MWKRGWRRRLTKKERGAARQKRRFFFGPHHPRFLSSFLGKLSKLQIFPSSYRNSPSFYLRNARKWPLIFRRLQRPFFTHRKVFGRKFLKKKKRRAFFYTHRLYPRGESNSYLKFRKLLFYPLNYRGSLFRAAYKARFDRQRMQS